MIDGLWTVAFQSNDDMGGGVVVISNDRVLGGDSSFTYIGEIQSNNDGNVTLTIAAKRFNSFLPPVIPGMTDYALRLSGSVGEKTMNLSGHVEGRPDMILSVIGTKKADL